MTDELRTTPEKIKIDVELWHRTATAQRLEREALLRQLQAAPASGEPSQPTPPSKPEDDGGEPRPVK